MSEHTQHLKLNFHFRNSITTQFIPIHGQEISLTTQQILKIVKTFLNTKNQSIGGHLNIFIERKGVRENLFKQKVEGKGITLAAERGGFEMNIIIEMGSDKSNLVKNFQANYDSYQRLRTNIGRVMEESSQKQQRQPQSSDRPIDIAYFFADPLIRLSQKAGTKLEILSTQNEVSYQVEYDQFISMVEKEDFRRNFRIEMMAATETNIINTLNEGASILHFSCHGDTERQLHIEHDKLIGQLIKLKPNTFMDLLSKGTLPKVIIFNVCYSYELAKEVSAAKNIITIGYRGKAMDNICEQFTKLFYMGLFKDSKSIRQLFCQIKDFITGVNSEEGRKLHIFPEEEDSEREVTIISEPGESNIEFKKRWRALESLRNNDCLGVKQEMYKLIKTLTNEQRMSYLFLEGSKNSGKTNLVHKTRIYTINRKVFTDDMMIDLKQGNGQYLQTLLSMRLTLESKIQSFRLQVEKKQRGLMQGTVSSLIIIDHAQKILRYQYSQFMRYIEKQLRDKLKYGEIVIITRREEPLCQRSAIQYTHANRMIKQEKDIDMNQFYFFIRRYYSEEYQKEIKRIRKQKKQIKYINLIKAIKMSTRPQQIQSNLQMANINFEFQPQMLQMLLQQQMVDKEIDNIQKQTWNILKDINLQVAQHHHIYLSTILQQISDKKHIHSHLHKNQILQKKQPLVHALVQKFKAFFKKSILQQPTQTSRHFKKITRLSFKIAGLCYLTKSHLQTHLLNCQTLCVMAHVLLLNPIYQVHLKLSRSYSHGHEQQQPQNVHFQDPQLQQVHTILKQYKIMLLLTMYTFFTERYQEIHSRKTNHSIDVQSYEQPKKKAGIVLDQLYHIIQKRSSEHDLLMRETFLKKYQEINRIIQQTHFIDDNNVKSSQSKSSEEFNSSIRGEVDSFATRIHCQHLKIGLYWQLYLQIIRTNNHFVIMSRDSQVLLALTAIKLIKSNQTLLEYLQARDPNCITRDMQNYIQHYLSILEQIKESRIFLHENRSHSHYLIWKYPQIESIKTLFKTYYSIFIRVYFQLQKLHQSLTKNYQIKIYNELLLLSSIYPNIKMVSTRKDIQMHKQTQFLSNYNCQTYIALPLLKYKNLHQNYGNRINLRRYERHIHAFQQKFFHHLDRQIKHDIFLLNGQFFKGKERVNKSLIQLIVANCTDTVVQCQSFTSKGQNVKIQDIQAVPRSPVVILFGTNVGYLLQTFRKLDSSSVIIVIDLKHDQHPSQRELLFGSSNSESMKVKEERLEKIGNYSTHLQIAYSVLEFFYTSFCKHFFTVQHVLFLEQVKSSYHFALAQAHIKTKIRFQKDPKCLHSPYIKNLIQNIQITLGSKVKNQLQGKLAYHFMFKQIKQDYVFSCISKLTQSKTIDQRDEVTRAEIGCNIEAFEILTQIDQEKKDNSNFVILYKSPQMLGMLKNTLIYKLKKYKKYDVETQIAVPQSMSLRSSSVTLSGRMAESEHSNEEKNTKVYLFQDLSERQFLDETLSVTQEPIVRCFFTKQNYSAKLPNTQIRQLQQSYNTQKIQFELYFTDCKKAKPNLSAKSLMTAFRKAIEMQSAGLTQIRKSIQMRNQ